MAETVRQIDYFYIEIPNRVGEGAKALQALSWTSFLPTQRPLRRWREQGDDRIGAVADLVGKLAEAKINVIAVDAVSVDERYGALCWVAPRDVKKAATLLGAV